MLVRLLGTGSADGWPNPWCTCASCMALRVTGESRGQTAALVDETLLLDCGPDVPRTAARLGVRLDRVRSLVFTHAHPDHCGPAALLWRQWVPGLGPLEVAGPPTALDLCRDWVGPADQVSWLPLAPGADVLLASGHRLRALPAVHEATPTLLYDVTGADGTALLYASDTAPPLPTPLPSVRYDVVLLECTGQLVGDHHDLDSWLLSIAGLRRVGAVDATTTVVPVHLGHRNPPTPELRRRVAPAGGVVLGDGDLVPLAGPVRRAEPPTRGPSRVLITGGARSGKSLEAERRLLAEPAVTYVATSLPRPGDEEWALRLAAHRRRRPAQWTTVETLHLGPLLADPAATLLVDCATLWLGAHLELPAPALAAAVDALVVGWRDALARVVLVTNEVGSGVVPPTEAGRRFADELGRLNARLAEHSDEVWQVVAGTPVRLR